MMDGLGDAEEVEEEEGEGVDGGDGGGGGGSLMDAVICPDKPIFKWWIETETRQAVLVLRTSFHNLVSTADSATDDDDKPTDDETKPGGPSKRDPTALHPTAETCLALLHALHAKSTHLRSPAHRRRFLSSTTTPLVMEFMECADRDAAAARHTLTKRRDVGGMGGKGGGLLGRGSWWSVWGGGWAWWAVRTWWGIVWGGG